MPLEEKICFWDRSASIILWKQLSTSLSSGLVISEVSVSVSLPHTHRVVNIHTRSPLLSSIASEMLSMLHQSNSETPLHGRHILFIVGEAASLRFSSSCELKAGSCQKAWIPRYFAHFCFHTHTLIAYRSAPLYTHKLSLIEEVTLSQFPFDFRYMWCHDDNSFVWLESRKQYYNCRKY